MKNLQEDLATLTIWSRNVITSTREPPTCAWIRADIWRQDGVICSKNRKIVPYHRCARISRLMVSVPDYGSWYYFNSSSYEKFKKNLKRLILEPFQTPLFRATTRRLNLRLLWFFCHCFVDGNNIHLVFTLVRVSSQQAWPRLPFRMFSPVYFCSNDQRFARKLSKP